VASGVNNAVARAAGLLAVAGLPLAVGLTGEAYKVPALMSPAFRMAMVICAALLVVAAVLSALTIDNDVLRPEPDHAVAQPECLTCLPINAPPLEPGNPAEAASGPGNRVDAPPQAH
jgi:hypothetical protein